MRAAGRRGRVPKRWRTTTVPDPAAALPADLIGRDFATTTTALDARWCGDITYIHTWEGWLYLATVIDLTSRRVVGWATADHLRTDLIDQALTNAVTSRRPTRGVIFHADRGCQYTSAQYRRLADQHGVRLSVGRRGQCWDNAVAESFFATIKTELLDRRCLADSRRRSQGDLQLDRGLVQHPPPTFHTGLSQPCRLRGQDQPATRPTPGSLTTHRPCPSNGSTTLGCRPSLV